MSKVSGLGAAISVDDSSGSPQVITNDVTEFSLSTPLALQDVTGVDKSAHERLGLLHDASVSLKGVFNPATDMSHAVLSTVSSTAVNRTTKVTPTSDSTPYLSIEALFDNYELARAAGGELTWSAPGSLADGTTPAWVNS